MAIQCIRHFLNYMAWRFMMIRYYDTMNLVSACCHAFLCHVICLVVAEYDRVSDLRGLTKQELQQDLGMQPGTANKIMNHFQSQTDDSGAGGSRVFPGGTSTSAAPPRAAASSTYRWEWQQNEGNYIAYEGTQEQIEANHSSGQDSVVVSSNSSLFASFCRSKLRSALYR